VWSDSTNRTSRQALTAAPVVSRRHPYIYSQQHRLYGQPPPSRLATMLLNVECSQTLTASRRKRVKLSAARTPSLEVNVSSRDIYRVGRIDGVPGYMRVGGSASMRLAERSAASLSGLLISGRIPRWEIALAPQCALVSPCIKPASSSPCGRQSSLLRRPSFQSANSLHGRILGSCRLLYSLYICTLLLPPWVRCPAHTAYIVLVYSPGRYPKSRHSLRRLHLLLPAEFVYSTYSTCCQVWRNEVQE
jgi:hypothetical protein